jgi:hypothetical protein
MKKMTLVVGLFGAMLSGCAGSVNGTVGGVNLSVADAIFAVLKDDAGKSIAALVVLADKPKICDNLKANREPNSATALSLTLFRFSATDYLAPDPADYTVVDTNTNPPMGAGSYTSASFNRTDTTCKPSTEGSGKSGLVKLTNLKAETNGVANGTFDITFSTGDKVTGNFNATYCDLAKLPQTMANCE